MDERARLATVWPFFGLVVRTPRLELRHPTDADLVDLADRTDDIHDPDVQPFARPWSTEPAAVRRPATLQNTWRARAELSPERWVLHFVIVVDDEVVGACALRATRFAVRRTVDTGSWLHRPRQGRGLGTETRAALLHLAFAGLGAARAETAAYDGNAASTAVTRRLGYRENGRQVDDLDGQVRWLTAFALDRDTWQAGRRADIELVGLDPCRPFLGAP